MRRSLEKMLSVLEAFHGKPRPPLRTRDPLELLYFENVGYLVDDERRRETYDAFVKEVGTDPDAVLRTPPARLARVIARGGMSPAHRARKLLKVAAIAKAMGGDLRAVARLPAEKAARALMRFPGIGPPGAAKILSMVGAHALPAFESNGVRALARLGFGAESASYTATYRSVLRAASKELAGERAARMVRAHLLLRTHGQTLCTRKAPRCHECPLSGDCPSFPA